MINHRHLVITDFKQMQRSLHALHLAEGLPQRTFGINQELSANHDIIILGQPFEHFRPAFIFQTGQNFARLKSGFIQGHHDKIAILAFQDRIAWDRQAALHTGFKFYISIGTRL